jgi:site-specific DNA recombinase
MTTSGTKKKNGEERRYYRCTRSTSSRGDETCENNVHVPAEKIERIVVEKIGQISRDENLQAALKTQLSTHADEYTDSLRATRDQQTRAIRSLETEGSNLVAQLATLPSGGGSIIGARLGEIENEISTINRAVERTDEQMGEMVSSLENSEAMLHVLGSFDDVWEELVVEEQRKLVHLVVRRITWEPKDGELNIQPHDLGGEIQRSEQT